MRVPPPFVQGGEMEKKQTDMKHLLWATHNTQDPIKSFLHPCAAIKITPIYQWGHQGTENLSNSLMVTQLDWHSNLSLSASKPHNHPVRYRNHPLAAESWRSCQTTRMGSRVGTEEHIEEYKVSEVISTTGKKGLLATGKPASPKHTNWKITNIYLDFVAG